MTGSNNLLNKTPLSLLCCQAQRRSFHPCWERTCSAKSDAADTLLPSKSLFNTRTWQTNGEGVRRAREEGEAERDRLPPTHTQPLAGHLKNQTVLHTKATRSQPQHTISLRTPCEDAVWGRAGFTCCYERAAKSIRDIFHFVRCSVTDGQLVIPVWI